MDVWQVQTVAPNEESATNLAGSAVSAKLAAGGHVTGPVTSVFWHLGEYGTGAEWQVVLKTTADKYAELEKHLTEHHPWTNPEITAVQLTAGSEAYLEWVRRTVS
jgi:periplasmic divalent cation tolerance protein